MELEKVMKRRGSKQNKSCKSGMALGGKVCPGCGRLVDPYTVEVYTAQQPTQLLQPTIYFDACDCPYCGCQVELAPRCMRVEHPMKMNSQVTLEDIEEGEADV